MTASTSPSVEARVIADREKPLAIGLQPREAIAHERQRLVVHAASEQHGRQIELEREMIGAVGEPLRHLKPQPRDELAHVARRIAQVGSLASQVPVARTRCARCVQRLDRHRRFGQAAREMARREIALLLKRRRAKQRRDLPFGQKLLKRAKPPPANARPRLQAEGPIVLQRAADRVDEVGPKRLRRDGPPLVLAYRSEAFRQHREHLMMLHGYPSFPKFPNTHRVFADADGKRRCAVTPA